MADTSKNVLDGFELNTDLYSLIESQRKESVKQMREYQKMKNLAIMLGAQNHNNYSYVDGIISDDGEEKSDDNSIALKKNVENDPTEDFLLDSSKKAEKKF